MISTTVFTLPPPLVPPGMPQGRVGAPPKPPSAPKGNTDCGACPSEAPALRQALRGRPDDRGESLRVEAGSAHQRPIDVRLLQEFPNVVGFDTAAVEHAHRVAGRVAAARG